jgi:hypothetical protein
MIDLWCAGNIVMMFLHCEATSPGEPAADTPVKYK